MATLFMWYALVSAALFGSICLVSVVQRTIAATRRLRSVPPVGLTRHPSGGHAAG